VPDHGMLVRIGPDCPVNEWFHGFSLRCERFQLEIESDTRLNC